MKFKEAHTAFRTICSYEIDQTVDDLFCILHDGEYLGDHQANHVCLACNLSESLAKIERFLSDSSRLDESSSENIEYLFTVYILLLYLSTEKLHTIFKVIGITWDYVEENWNVLVEIRKWANFFKHPKGFLFTHHLQFVFETSARTDFQKNSFELGYEFVQKFYFREDERKFRQTLTEIGNKDNITVILPCPERLALEFIEVCKQFSQKIKDNEHFQTILKSHALSNEF